MHPVHRTEAQTPALSLSMWHNERNLNSSRATSVSCLQNGNNPQGSAFEEGSFTVLGFQEAHTDFRSSPPPQFTWYFCQLKIPWQRTVPLIVLIFICENACETCSHREQFPQHDAQLYYSLGTPEVSHPGKSEQDILLSSLAEFCRGQLWDAQRLQNFKPLLALNNATLCIWSLRYLKKGRIWSKVWNP